MIKRYFKLDRKNIAAVQFILEGYENMANVTTMDSRIAVIRIAIVGDFLCEINTLLDRLKMDYSMQEVDPAGNP